MTRALEMSVVKLGAKLYKEEGVSVIEENHENQFTLMTANYTVTADKLVLAVPVKAFKLIKGYVAERIQNNSMFDSIEIMAAFKGFAVFQGAW